MKSILFIIPYFGKWPIWFDAHLISIEKNSSINWLIVTDCEIPLKKPSNIKFVKMEFSDFNHKINDVLDMEIPLSVRKICDIRPAFGEIFEEYLVNYDFWGFCDVDIIWGDIRKFLKNKYLDQYDIISSLHEMISGHFTLFKNNKKINSLYRYKNLYMDKFMQTSYTRFEEYGFAELLKEMEALKSVNLFWNTDYSNSELISVSHQEYHLDRWMWNDGHIFNTIKGQEIMYLHFINWKSTMKFNKIKFVDSPSLFYISYTGIHYYRHLKVICFINNFKNVFNGYWVGERSRLRKNKIDSLLKRMKRKLICFFKF